jgi:hypothetical protein
MNRDSSLPNRGRMDPRTFVRQRYNDLPNIGVMASNRHLSQRSLRPTGSKSGNEMNYRVPHWVALKERRSSCLLTQGPAMQANATGTGSIE